MKVFATVMWPVSVEIELAEDIDEFEAQEQIKAVASEILETSTIKPIIHDCSVSSFIE